MIDKLLIALRRWPLLVVGLALFLWGISLADKEDPSDARALLLGVAAVLIGAGMVVVVGNETADRYEDNKEEKLKKEEEESSDE